eukprot:TRINITY_DN1982_c1_g1_i1.p2 TRINITY_DN1982_c1_g1~~TRINITY_DN1982_c1_g1_i1.p2  ORF type:complete len:664 (-),score=119.09 TRINITY_DN1982_c1_g1_i1:2238-4229(-)
MEPQPQMMMLAPSGAENSASGGPFMILPTQPLVFATDGSSMQPMPQYYPVYTTGAPMGQRQWMMPFGTVMPTVPQVAYSPSMQSSVPSFGFQPSAASPPTMPSPPPRRSTPQPPPPPPAYSTTYKRPAPLPAPAPAPTKLPQKPQRRSGRPRKNPVATDVAPFSRMAQTPYTAALAAGLTPDVIDLEDDLDLDEPAPVVPEKADPPLKWSLEEDFTIVESHSKLGDDWEAVWKSLPNPSKYTPVQVKQRWIELSNEQPSTRPKRNPVSAYGDDMIPIDEAIGELETKKPRKRPPSHNTDLSFVAKRHKPQSAQAHASPSHTFIDHSGDIQSRYDAPLNWTPAEDAQLASWVELNGADSWEAAAAAILGKTAIECRERWSENSRLDLNKGRYTEQEDEAILKWQYEMGPVWEEIARRMGTNRSASDVHKRHSYLMRETNYQGQFGNYARKVNSRVLKTLRVDLHDPEPEPVPTRQSQRRIQQSHDDSESRQHSAVAEDDDMEVSLPFDSPDLLASLSPDPVVKRGRGRPRKVPQKVDPNDEIDMLVEQHLHNAGVSKSAESEYEGRSSKLEVPSVDSVDDIDDIAEVKAKYVQLTGMFKSLAEQHAKAQQRNERVEQHLLQQVSDLKTTISNLKAIKFIDMGEATVKLVPHEDASALEQPGVAL